MNRRVLLMSFTLVAGVQWCAMAQETSGTAEGAVTSDTKEAAAAVAATPTPAAVVAAEPPAAAASADRPHQNRNPLTGLPASLAAMRNYRSMRVSSEDRKGNADMRRIEPKATLIAAELEGPGEITHLWTTIATPNENHLRDTIIRIYWDGNSYPSVECPIGDFYGLGHAKYYMFNNPVQAIGSDKGMNAFWPMPFAKSAKVTVTNESDVPIDAYYYYVDWRKFDTMPQNLGYFHAQYHQAFPNESGKSYLILDADGGPGHYVGVSLSIHTLVGGWWGEGDDIFTIDGEATPSLWGTGSEDYFCGAWCYKETFFNDYFGMPLRSKMSHDADNYWNVYRLHLESPVAFKQSLKVEIEHGANGFDNTRAVSNNNYSSVTYWYQETPRPLKGELAPREKRISHYQAPVAQAGVYEFNTMHYTTPTGIEAEAQTMANFGMHGGKWFHDDHLWIRGLKAEQKLELSFETNAVQSGEAVLRVTKAPDYGKVAVSLDGLEIASYDGYAERVEPAVISLGQMDLAKGKHRLVITGKGKNEISRDVFAGFDYLRVGATAPKMEREGVTAPQGGEKAAEKSDSAKAPERSADDGSRDTSERPRRRTNTRRR